MNDNYSAFLRAFDGQEQHKADWVGERMREVELLLDQYKKKVHSPDIKQQIDGIHQQIDTGGNFVQNVSHTVGMLNKLIDGNKATEEIGNGTPEFKNMVSIFIDIAKYTHSENIAEQTVKLGDKVNELMHEQ